MKSIKRKLLLSLNVLMIVACLSMGAVALAMAVFMLKDNVERDLQAVAEQVSHSVSLAMEGELTTLETIAAREDIQSQEVSIEDKLTFLSKEAKRLDAIRISYADVDGTIHYPDGTTADVSQREYFKQAMEGHSYVSEPITNKKDGSVVIVYAAPIHLDGAIVGALIQSIDGYKLSDIVNGQKFGESGFGFIVNEEGTIIAHDTKEYVKEGYNPKEDKENKEFAEAVQQMITDQAGATSYKSEGMGEFIGYAAVEGKPWFVGVQITKDEVYVSIDNMFNKLAISFAIFIVVGMIVVSKVAVSLGEKITTTTKHLEKVAAGDLTEPVPGKNLMMKDEIGLMSNAMQAMQDSIANMVREIQTNSSELGNKSEELSKTSTEIAKLSDTITHAISEISEGTSHQSNELVSITAVLNQFNDKLASMQSQVEQVDGTSRKIDKMAVQSSEEMNDLNASVGKISDTFKNFEESIAHLDQSIAQINHITGLIKDVADQTNLLALNASIEAARAGEAGRGFAVVAEEIGNLADQSKNSSQSVTTLISGISKETEALVSDAGQIGKELKEQVETINRSIKTFTTIIEEVNEIIPMIQSVRESGNEIDQDKNQILEKIDELSAVSEEICASSQEITASTSEMNHTIASVADSANVLNDMTVGMISQVNQFKV
ncbi:MAG: methyl-accepting chemotaxis protein [bacterium]|nr:methyl-accepting chemotaxis protein [bacterium]